MCGWRDAGWISIKWVDRRKNGWRGQLDREGGMAKWLSARIGGMNGWLDGRKKR